MSSASHDERTRRSSDTVVALPTPDEVRNAGAKGEHPKAVRTFIFEVSAGRPKGVGDATTGRALRFDPPIEFLRSPVEQGFDEADELDDDAAVLDVGDELDDAPRESHAAEGATTASLSWRVPPGKGGRRDRGRPPWSPDDTSRGIELRTPRPRRLSAWSASFVVHGAMVAALSLVTITQLAPREPLDLVMAPAVVEEVDFSTDDAPTDGEANLDAPLEQFSNAATGPVIDPGMPTLGAELGAGVPGDLTEELALTGGGGGGAEDGPFGGRGGAGGLFGNGTGGLAEFGTGLGAAPTAQFFGTKIDGRRIVFVLDNSGSMQGGRLETVIAELLRSVDSLDPKKQESYVIFYSDIAYPLFYPDPATNFVRPTDRNKKMLAAWLETVELCLGDAVVDALGAARSIEPDSIILLSDGRIQGERKMAFLMGGGGGQIPLHTVGVGLGGGLTAREKLQQIAEANGGVFREAEVPVEMRDLARKNPRPYHDAGPGLVWGRAVKPRRTR